MVVPSDGDKVGATAVGTELCVIVGIGVAALVGTSGGISVGAAVGMVVGYAVGSSVEPRVVGVPLGCSLGRSVWEMVGATVGSHLFILVWIGVVGLTVVGTGLGGNVVGDGEVGAKIPMGLAVLHL